MNSKTVYWLAALVIIAGLGIYAITGDSDTVATEPVTADTVPVEDTAVSESETEAGIDINEKTVPEGFPDVEKVLSRRTMGNPDAPIKVEEFASLTCNHCAAFYTNTFPEFKAKYIDSGKVFFIYRDFPLNAPALEAALAARCLPEDKYFQFIKFLYTNQSEWAYEANYTSYLKQNAKLLGLTEAEYDACVNSEELTKKFASKLGQYQQQYQLRSTPTFVINGEETIQGAQTLDVFDKVFAPFFAMEQGAAE